MKNIHILKTNKPSRLLKDLVDVTYQFKKEVSYGNRFELPLNIYITSDEEIKKGDGKYPVLGCKGTVYKDCPETWKESGDWKKIILTTDQDLIKDGVQAIDDEFLEWFVKHPSCEYVEVNKVSVNCSCANQSGYIDNANVILENSTCHLRNNCKTKHKIIIPKEEPKQETLEEAAENYSKITLNKQGLMSDKQINGFIAGAKWQAERMYSEDEVGELLYNIIGQYGKHYGIMIDGKVLNDLFEQFKKK